jgi:hypothetical protein
LSRNEARNEQKVKNILCKSAHLDFGVSAANNATNAAKRRILLFVEIRVNWAPKLSRIESKKDRRY